MWIEESEWNRIQQLVPIVCLDVLTVKVTKTGDVTHAGLIMRETPNEGGKWCTVGGRLLFGETVIEAVCRQLLGALGHGIDIHLLHDDAPMYTAQFYPGLHPAEGFDGADPRKHAVRLTYCAMIDGTIRPRNEAIDFRWFPLEGIAGNPEIERSQNDMILTCCERLQNHLLGNFIRTHSHNSYPYTHRHR